MFSPSGRPPSTQEACAIQRKRGHCCGGAPHALWRPWRVSRKLLVILCCACNCGSPSIILRKMRVIVLAAFALLPASVTCFSSVSARTSASLPRVHLRSQAATTYVDGQARVGPEAATLPTPTEAAELGVVVPTRPQPADDLLPAPTTKEVVTFGMPVSALFISNFALGAVDTAATGRFGGLMDLAALAPGTAAMEYACYVLSAIATVTLNQLAPTQPGGKEWNERLGGHGPQRRCGALAGWSYLRLCECPCQRRGLPVRGSRTRCKLPQVASNRRATFSHGSRLLLVLLRCQGLAHALFRYRSRCAYAGLDPTTSLGCDRPCFLALLLMHLANPEAL